MLIFGPLGGCFLVFGHNSGPGPLRTKIFGSGGSSHIVGIGRVHILNLRFFLENESLLVQKTVVLMSSARSHCGEIECIIILGTVP